jgi:FkbM family methyltransferase
MFAPLNDFWKKPLELKSQALRYHFKTKLWGRTLPWLPLPLHLPFGAWWLAYNDAHSDAVFAGFLDGSNQKFLARCLRPGMITIDIGAHHGYYTLLMAKMVQDTGRVIAFEPSPREFRRLRRHVHLNRCANVTTEPLAIAKQGGTREFFVVDGQWTVRNSLRCPETLKPSSLRVPATTLDDYLIHHSEIRGVDFIKLDIEGAELEALHGAKGLLSCPPRPLILCELNDPVIRECLWSHRAADIVQFLEDRGYAWFAISQEGGLCQPPNRGWLSGDFVFVPEERSRETGQLLVRTG